MKFSATFYIFAALAATALATTVKDFENSIDSITAQTTTLDNDATKFPNSGGSILAALAIHSDAATLKRGIDQATSNLTVIGSISESDGQIILGKIQKLQPTILDALTQIAAKKDGFTSLPIGNVPALVLQDLKSLNSSTALLGSHLITAVVSPSIKSNLTSIKTAIDVAFSKCIAVYS